MENKLKMNKKGLRPTIFLTKNRRGDISITLLVIGVFAICTLAIVSFLLHDKINPRGFADLETIEDLSSKAEDFYFYINSGLSQQEAAERIGAQIQDNKLILSAEQRESSNFGFRTRDDSKVVLSVQYIIDLNR